MSRLAFSVLPTLHNGLLSDLRVITGQQQPGTSRMEVNTAAPSGSEAPVMKEAVTSTISQGIIVVNEEETAAASTQSSLKSRHPAPLHLDNNNNNNNTDGEEEQQEQQHDSVVTSHPEPPSTVTCIDRLRTALWVSVLNRAFSPSTEEGRSRLNMWCEQPFDSSASMAPSSPSSLMELRSSSKSLVILLSSTTTLLQLPGSSSTSSSMLHVSCDSGPELEAPRPQEIVQGCLSIIQSLMKNVLNGGLQSSAFERAEAAAIVALCVYVKTFWGYPATTMVNKQDESHAHYRRVVKALVEEAARSAVTALDKFAIHSEFITVSLKNAAICSDKKTMRVTTTTTTTVTTTNTDDDMMNSNSSNNKASISLASATTWSLSRSLFIRQCLVANHDDEDEDEDQLEKRQHVVEEADDGDARHRRRHNNTKGDFDVLGHLPLTHVTEDWLRIDDNVTTTRSSNGDEQQPPLSQSEISLSATVSSSVFPLRHVGATARRTPFVSARGTLLLSTGSNCLLLGRSDQLSLVSKNGFRSVDSNMLSELPPTTAFRTTFGTGGGGGGGGLGAAAAAAAAEPHHHAQQGYSNACVVRELRRSGTGSDDSSPIVAAATDGGGGASRSALHFFDTSRAVALNSSPQGFARSCSIVRTGHSDQILNPEVLPSASSPTQSLGYCVNRVEVVDKSNLAIQSVASLGYGILAVGPVLRVLNVRDVLPDDFWKNNADGDGDGCDKGEDGDGKEAARQQRLVECSTKSPFLRFQPRSSLSVTYGGDQDTVTATSLCGYGNEHLVSARGDEVSLWAMASGDEASVISMGDHQFVTCVASSYQDHLVAVGTSSGIVGLWDTRCGKKPSRLFRADKSAAGAYATTCAVQSVKFGATGGRSIFLTTPTDASASQVRLFHVGYERCHAWQSPSDMEVARFDVGTNDWTRRTSLHILNRDGVLYGGDVSFLVA